MCSVNGRLIATLRSLVYFVKALPLSAHKAWGKCPISPSAWGGIWAEVQELWGDLSLLLAHSAVCWYLKIAICPILDASQGPKATHGFCQVALSCVSSFMFYDLYYSPFLLLRCSLFQCVQYSGRQKPQVGHLSYRSLSSSSGVLRWQRQVCCVSFMMPKCQRLSRASGQKEGVWLKWTAAMIISWDLTAKWMRKDSDMLGHDMVPTILRCEY